MRARLIEIAVLLVILGATAAMRGPGLVWGVQLEPGATPKVPRTDEATFMGHFKNYPKYQNVYPPQTAIHALVLDKLAMKVVHLFDPTYTSNDFHICVVGRTSTFIFGLAFLTLFFFAGRSFGLKTLPERALATGMLAFSPLISVYGHLFLADAVNIFWIWLAYLAFIKCVNRDDERYAFLFALAAGFAGSTKLATTYCVIPGLVLLFCSHRPFSRALMMAFVATGAFWVGSGFTYEMGKLEWTYRYLGDIQTAGAQDVDIVRNLRNQATFFLAGLGIPTVLLAVGGLLLGLCRLGRWLALTLRPAAWWPLKHIGSLPGLRRRAIELCIDAPMTVIYAGLMAQFVLFVTVDLGGSFARHVIPFLPPMAIVAVRFLIRLPWMSNRWVSTGACAALLAYGLVLCADGERGYHSDPRNRARAWLKANRPKEVPVVHGPYSLLVVAGLPNVIGVRELGPSPLPRIGGDHVLVTHQATWGRYLLADSCDKIHHCFGGEPARSFFVDLVRGKSKQYRLWKAFTAGYFMPEHRLLGRVVPTHPYPEVGTVLIFRAHSGGRKGKQD